MLDQLISIITGQPINSGTPSLAVVSTAAPTPNPNLAYMPLVPTNTPIPSAATSPALSAIPSTGLNPSFSPSSGVLPSAILSFTPTPSAPPNSSSGTQPIALVYHDASTDCCAQTLATMIQNDTKWNFKVLLVGPSESTSVQAGLALPGAKLYAQPGGNGDDTTAFAAQQGDVTAIQNFVKNGGRFLGVCMGGYLAGKDMFGVFPVPANEYITEPGASTTSTADTVIPITWRGKVRQMYFQDGPSFIIPAGTPGVTVLATYSNGEVADAVATYGSGKTAVSGPHPEADQSWYSAYKLPYPGSTQDLGNDLIDTLMQ